MDYFSKRGLFIYLRWILVGLPILLLLEIVGAEIIKSDSVEDEGKRITQTRNYLQENHLHSESENGESAYIEQCFAENNPFKYCLVLLVEAGGWLYVDENLESPYEVFMFDNGPDYSVEGLYRIRQNGKIGYADATTGEIVIDPLYQCAYPFEGGQAKVSFVCDFVKEGGHFAWISETWFYISKP